MWKKIGINVWLAVKMIFKILVLGLAKQFKKAGQKTKGLIKKKPHAERTHK